MQISLKKAAEILGGKCVNCGDEFFTSVTTDTRKIEDGSLFIALCGEKFDGHEFAQQAIENGAVAVVSEKPAKVLGNNVRAIEVKSTYEALLSLAGYYREELDLCVVGVTGSVGKTTTKDMIASVLSQGMKTLKTQGNLNNHIGVPKTIFDINESDDAAVIEMGMNHKGEISVLSKTAQPDIAVITCIGVSHIENLGTRQGILEAKLEILDGMKPDAPIIINADNDILGELKELSEHPLIRTGINAKDADITAKNIIEGTEGSRFDVYVGQNFFVSLFLPAIGIHNIQNALLAVAVGVEMGLSELQIATGIAAYAPTGMRQKITKIADITFIEDCYNASPTSMFASLTTLSSLAQGKRAIAVLGDMLELGNISESSHLEVGQFAAEKCSEVVCCGKFAQKIYEGAQQNGCKAKLFDSNEKTAQYLVKTLKDGDVVLFKASHSMRFEEIISAVYASFENTSEN